MLKKINNKGFTIIEVLIVLAIAGLILLVVFLAVPALQRNSRNTAMKADVQNLGGGVSEYRANNNGKTPAMICGTGDVVLHAGTVCGTVVAPSQTTKIQGSTSVTMVATSGTAPADSALDPGTIQVDVGKKCATTFGGTGVASARTVSLYYVTETSASADSFQCLEV